MTIVVMSRARRESVRVVLEKESIAKTTRLVRGFVVFVAAKWISSDPHPRGRFCPIRTRTPIGRTW